MHLDHTHLNAHLNFTYPSSGLVLGVKLTNIRFFLSASLARLSPAHTESIFMDIGKFRLGQAVNVRQFQRLLGLIAAASNTFGPFEHETIAAVAQDQGIFPKGQPFLHHLDYTQILTYPSDVEETLVLGPRSCVEGIVSSQNTNNRCFPHKLGCDPRWPLCSGSAERSPYFMAHKLPGDEGCISASEILLPDLRGYHVLVRSDNTSVVPYINH